MYQQSCFSDFDMYHLKRESIETAVLLGKKRPPCWKEGLVLMIDRIKIVFENMGGSPFGSTLSSLPLTPSVEYTIWLNTLDILCSTPTLSIPYRYYLQSYLHLSSTINSLTQFSLVTVCLTMLLFSPFRCIKKN